MNFFNKKTTQSLAEASSIRRWQAVIEFDLDGNILEANDLFLKTVGYDRSEVIGKHHAMFVPQDERASTTYQNFWRDLRSGKAFQAEFARITKTGARIWLQATYTPICGTDGSKPFKVIKYATDITPMKAEVANAAGQLAAIQKSQAVIEFDLDGTIRDANENFLTTLGYSLAEIKGRKHDMLVEPAERARRDAEQRGRGEGDGVCRSRAPV